MKKFIISFVLLLVVFFLTYRIDFLVDAKRVLNTVYGIKVSILDLKEAIPITPFLTSVTSWDLSSDRMVTLRQEFKVKNFCEVDTSIEVGRMMHQVGLFRELKRPPKCEYNILYASDTSPDSKYRYRIIIDTIQNICYLEIEDITFMD